MQTYFRITDSMGLENTDKGMHTDDIPLLLKGHIKNEYQVSKVVFVFCCIDSCAGSVLTPGYY